MIPTKEQTKGFWEWCGLKYLEPLSLKNGGVLCGFDSKIGVAFVRVDLNSLFKYAVPKLALKILMMETYKDGFEFCILSEETSGDIWVGRDKDPALALFWAIWKVFQSEKSPRVLTNKD